MTRGPDRRWIACSLVALPWLVPGATAQAFELAQKRHLPAESIIAGVATLADFDGDGVLDLFSAPVLLLGTNIVGFRTYRNDGSGVFSFQTGWPQQLATTYRLSAHATGDLDGDGDVDLLLRGTTYLNRGVAGFLSVPNILTEDPHLVVDLDGDGIGDVISAHATIWLVRPGPTFVQVATPPRAQQWIDDIAVADFDNDGDPDLLLATSPQTQYPPIGPPIPVPGLEIAWRNNGLGQFTDVSATWLPAAVSTYTAEVFAADLDGDGDIDCAFTELLTARGWSFRRNDGTGRLLSWAGPWIARNGYPDHPFKLVDLDRDGDMDFVHAGEWLRNDGASGFATQPIATPDKRLLATGDVDGDGDVDLLFADGSLLLDQGAQSFVDASAPPTDGRAGAPVVADFDNDGDLDLLRAAAPLQRNRGSGQFTPLPFPWFGRAGYLPSAFDVDVDGDVDVAYFTFTYPSTGELRIGLNDGTARFTDATALAPAGTVTGRPTLAVPLDADSDGVVDLVVATSYIGLHLLRNVGASAFVVGVGALPPLTGDCRALTAADFDGDGDVDLLAVVMSQTLLSVLVNDGRGNFVDSPAQLAGAIQFSPWGCSLWSFDADGDGDRDVLVGSGAGSPGTPIRHRLLRNDGTGRLVDDPTALPTHVPGDGAVVGDVDGDGDVDIIAATTQGRQLWRNDGQGLFQYAGLVPVWFDPSALMADVDGDGDADLVTRDRVFTSRQWQAAAPRLLRVSRTYELEFGGLGVGSGGFAWPVVATSATYVPLPGAGTLIVDPTTTLPLPWVPLPGGSGTLQIKVPNYPALLDADFVFQAILTDGSRFHLSPAIVDRVRTR